MNWNAFHQYHKTLGSDNFSMLPSEDFCSLQDYIDYLRNEIQIGAFDVEVNGGAQFRRLMMEVEIFLRFSEIAVEIKKRDVIQARGVSMSSLTWRDVVVKLLSHEAHLPLQRRVAYVGERIKWFFEIQKEAVLEFMEKLEGSPTSNLFSPLYPKHAKLIKQNAMIKHAVWQTYDQACKRQLRQFVELFENMLTSTFSNPWVFLKGATQIPGISGDFDNAYLPSFDDTKNRILEKLKAEVAMKLQSLIGLQRSQQNHMRLTTQWTKCKSLCCIPTASSDLKCVIKLSFSQSLSSSCLWWEGWKKIWPK